MKDTLTVLQSKKLCLPGEHRIRVKVSSNASATGVAGWVKSDLEYLQKSKQKNTHQWLSRWIGLKYQLNKISFRGGPFVEQNQLVCSGKINMTNIDSRTCVPNRNSKSSSRETALLYKGKLSSRMTDLDWIALGHLNVWLNLN